VVERRRRKSCMKSVRIRREGRNEYDIDALAFKCKTQNHGVAKWFRSCFGDETVGKIAD
jgi:hypothetical protein